MFNVVGSGQTVQLAVFNNVRCVLNNVEGVCQTNIHLLNKKSNIYRHYFYQFFIRKDSSVVSTRFINERSQVRVPGTALDRYFFLSVHDDILLACDI